MDSVEPPEPGSDETVHYRGTMDLGNSPETFEAIWKYRRLFSHWLLGRCMTCNCDGTLDNEEGKAHILISDQRITIRYAQLQNNDFKTCCYYCCFCFSGNCLCPENRRQATQDEYTFSASEIKDMQVVTSQERIETNSCITCMPDYTVNFTTIRLGFVSRYGEFVPGKQWTSEDTFLKCHRTIAFSGYIDQEAAKEIRSALSKIVAENRGGARDAAYAAPFPGVGKSSTAEIGKMFKSKA